MSFARPARCLICSFSRAAATAPRVPRRQFQLSATQLADKANKGDKSLTPAQPTDGKLLKQITDEMTPDHFKPYTEEEKAWLKQHYTPEQLAAVEAGEAAIDPKDLAEQFRIRTDPMKFKYLDDFSVIEPGVDKHIRAPQSNSDYNAKLKTSEDFTEDFGKFFEEMPDNIPMSEWVKFIETVRLTKGKEENELNPHSSLVPDLFEAGETLKGHGTKPIKYDPADEPKPVERLKNEPNDAMKQLMKVTGYSWEAINQLKVRTLVTRSVVNQTRLGKVRSSYVLSIAGNGNGLLGLGEGKSQEGSDAHIQARLRAMRNMKPIPRYEKRTIFGDVTGKSGAVQVKLMSRPPGFGLRCQSLIYEMCRAAGIDDIAAKVPGARNKMNTVKATYQALLDQRDPEEIARARGKKLVDVRKVYHSGRVDYTQRQKTGRMQEA
ncbi:mitochondrial 37S ribosomal protein uS5m [Aspergillus undulatus]|uniref:mitochondrial 37S ribosomal protein uS5m n=1 Tax=Aspergillus undulatus TaxID=1810928 RepID=UPI003CCD4D9F